MGSGKRLHKSTARRLAGRQTLHPSILYHSGLGALNDCVSHPGDGILEAPEDGIKDTHDNRLETRRNRKDILRVAEDRGRSRIGQAASGRSAGDGARCQARCADGVSLEGRGCNVTGKLAYTGKGSLTGMSAEMDSRTCPFKSIFLE